MGKSDEIEKTSFFLFFPEKMCIFPRSMMVVKSLLNLRIASLITLFLVFGGAKIICADDFTLTDLDEVVHYEIFPFSEYEKLEKLKEQDACRDWANNIGILLKRLIFQLESSPGKGQEELSALDMLLASPPDSQAVSHYEVGERFTARSVAGVLKSRVAIWQQVLLLLEREQSVGHSTAIPQKRIEDAERLYEKSDVIRRSLLANKNGQAWVQFLQLTPLHGQLGQTLASRNQETAKPVEKYARDSNTVLSLDTNDFELAAPGLLSEGESRRISLLVNNVFLMKERAPLTPEQAQMLETPLIRDWLDELETWRSDPLHPLDLLAAYECYRQYQGTSDGSRLAVATQQMLGSRNREWHRFGQSVQNEFSHAHLKLYVSNYLINTMLPKLKPEFDSVRENVAGQHVTGMRRADTQMHVTLIPDPARLLMTLHYTGQVVTQTTATVFPATIHNQSQGAYSATKQLELTSRGFVTRPANISANSRVRLHQIETDLDIVPIVSDLIRGIARDQYESQHPQIQAETQVKMTNQAKQRIDSETDMRFRILNEQMDRFFFSVLRQRRASLEQYEARTTDEWLLTSWYLATPGSLGSDTKEPATPQGSIADLKVHESGISAALERLELAGKRMTLRELKRYLVSMIGQPNLEIPEEDNDHVVIAFADRNPVGVRFLQNRVELSLNLKRLQVEDRAWENFCVIAGYVPDVTPEGTPCLVHNGPVHLDGRLTFMQQVALRTIFSKIFLHVHTIPLRPGLFDNDERFTGLATGHVRIENGWFAIALLPQEVPATTRPKQPSILTRSQQPPSTQQSPVLQPQRITSRPTTTQTVPQNNVIRR